MRPLRNSQITTCSVSVYVSHTTSAMCVTVNQGFVLSISISSITQIKFKPL